MAAIAQDITIWSGDNVELDLSLFEADGTTALNIAGATVNWALASIYDLDKVLIVKSSANPGEIDVTDAIGGLVKIFIVQDDTDNLGGEPYYHEVEVISGGTTVTVMSGVVTINKTTLH